jgi:hypothetical protein
VKWKIADFDDVVCAEPQESVALMGEALIEEQHHRTIVGLCNSLMSECRKEDVQKPIIEELRIDRRRPNR